MRQRKIEVVAGIAGQRLVPGVGRAQRHLQPVGQQRVHHVEHERIGVARPRLCAVAQRHGDRPGCIDGAGLEWQVARKAMLCQRVHGALPVAPMPGDTVHEVPADKREQQRIAPAHLGRAAPVSVVGPVENVLAAVHPAHQAPAVLRGEQQEVVGIADADQRLALEVLCLEQWHGGPGRRAGASSRHDKPARCQAATRRKAQLLV
ncbi:hypothetical protein D9M69_447860 [compost metagenome]